MTWGEWLESTYCTTNRFSVDEYDMVYYDDGCLDDSTGGVYSSQVIHADGLGYDYTTAELQPPW